jgi:glycosyltransferase involved in cell wall biosynthesis
MKILYPFHGVRVGGSIVSTSLLAEYMLRQGVDCLGVFPREGKSAQVFQKRGIPTQYYEDGRKRRYPGTDLDSLPKKLGFLVANLGMIGRAREILASCRPDLIHVNDNANLLLWGVAAKAMRIPLVWHIRGEYGNRIFDALRIRLADHLIFVADANRVRFSGRNRLPASSTVHNGVDLRLFSPPASRAAAKRELGVDPQTTTLCFVGNLVPRKRPDWCVRAFLRLRDSGRKAQMLMAGEDFSGGSHRRSLEDLLRGSGYEQDIHFLGYRTDIDRVLKASDILLLSSRKQGEAFPRSVIEAMACGAVVLSTRVAGVPEADAEDFDDFSGKLVEIVDDEAGRRRMAARALERAKEEFSAEACGRKVLRIYQDLLRERAVQSPPRKRFGENG